MTLNSSAKPEDLPISVALQGGGAHGAFSWGVLNRLLDDPQIRIIAVSGTSAGAMNACALVQGLAQGGKAAAKELLQKFWDCTSDAARFSPIQRSLLDRLLGRWSLEHSPTFMMAQQVQMALSPYQFNPLDINPLRDIVAGIFDFDVINNPAQTQLFLSATNVRTGRAKVFRQPEISANSVMASACLPHLFKAVEIDGEAYWDGGYMGNPPLFPLVDETEARDHVLIRVNPLTRPDIPMTRHDIDNRLNEITFNASLLKELRSLAFLWETINLQGMEREAYTEGRLHCIADDAAMLEFDVSSKMNAERQFLHHLRDVGYDAADRWLKDHRESIGVRGTFRTQFVFEESIKPAHIHEEAHAMRKELLNRANQEEQAQDAGTDTKTI